MKSNLLTAGFFYLTLCSYSTLFLIPARAQTVAVGADKMNVAYIGLENPMTIVIENCPCKNVLATADNGEIVRTDGCNFRFVPQQQGNATITVSTKINSQTKLIGKQQIRVKGTPKPQAMVGNIKVRSKFPANQFKTQTGISIVQDDLKPDLFYGVSEFRLIVVKKNGHVHVINRIEGNFFNKECEDLIQKLERGDRILFENIKVKGADGSILNFNAFDYTII